MWLGLFTESFSETAESLHLDRGCEICELAEKTVEIVCEFMAVVSLLVSSEEKGVGMVIFLLTRHLSDQTMTISLQTVVDDTFSIFYFYS